MPNERWLVARHLLMRLLLSCAAALVFDCQSAREDPTGGETHFLKRCDLDTQCGGDLECVCGVCTRPCSSATACEGLSNSSCVLPRDPAACELPAQHCDVTCSADVDCTALAGSERCVSGSCRGVDANGCAPGGVSANQVLIVGDSFFAASHRITAFLEDLARQQGLLSAGERYRDNSSLLGNALALQGNGIESQYAAASADSAVRVVIMNGGGADVLLGSCDAVTADCPLLVDAAAAARSVFARMAADGVEHIVYAFYPDPTDSALRARVDALRPLIASACQDSPVPCHWLDLRTTFAGNYERYLAPDGRDPSPDGAQASAAAISAVMQAQCIAQ